MGYAGSVGESVNEIRLTPVENGRQRVEWAHVRTDPPSDLRSHRDAYGNVVRWFQLVEPHERLVVESEAIVVTKPVPPRAADAGEPLAATADPTYADLHAEFLAGSPRVRWVEPVGGFADALDLDEDGSTLRWARSLEGAVNRAIAYTTGATHVDTPVEEVVRTRCGVCQDMAHLMIAIARRRGVAARYVSGWLHQPGVDQPGESHAWVEVAVPGIGWVEMDPTHPEPNLEDYVRLGCGRDYGDVPPLRGSYLGPPTDVMAVTVEVRRLD